MYMFGFFSQRGAWFRSLVSPLLCVCPEQSSGDAPGSVEMDSVWCGEPGHFLLPLTEEYGEPGHFLLPLTEQSIYADVGEVGFFLGGGERGVLMKFCFVFLTKDFLFQEEVAQIALFDLYEHPCLAMIFPVLTAKTNYSG